MEDWRDVVGYEGLYIVSNLGRVRSCDRAVLRSNGTVQNRKGILKKTSLDKDGYEIVSLSNHGTSKKAKVHRIVAEAFVDGYFDGAEVNHIDTDRTNNMSCNLEWVTHDYNILYSIECGNHVCTRDLTGANNPNFGNHKLHETYSSDKKLSIEKQGRRGSSNGSSVCVTAISDCGSIRFETLTECASYIKDTVGDKRSIQHIANLISRSIDSDTYVDGFRFEH